MSKYFKVLDEIIHNYLDELMVVLAHYDEITEKIKKCISYKELYNVEDVIDVPQCWSFSGGTINTPSQYFVAEPKYMRIKPFKDVTLVVFRYKIELIYKKE